MKLSAEQIEKIDTILEKLGLDFLDFKLEIKDHIASQTEDLCNERNFSFEEVLPLVLKEWESNLQQKTSIWISNKRSFSTVVLNGIKKRYLIYNSIATPIIVIFFLLHFLYRKETETNYWYQIMFSIGTILFLTLSVFRYLIFKMRKVTSYSYEFNRIYKMVAIFWLFDMVFYFSSGISPVDLWKAMIVTYMPIAIYSYYKHNQFCKRFKKFIV